MEKQILFDAIKEGYKQIQKCAFAIYISAMLVGIGVFSDDKNSIYINGIKTDTFIVGVSSFFILIYSLVMINELGKNLKFMIAEMKEKDIYLHKIATKYPSLVNGNYAWGVIGLGCFIYGSLASPVILFFANILTNTKEFSEIINVAFVFGSGVLFSIPGFIVCKQLITEEQITKE